jgi:hypothetical protein
MNRSKHFMIILFLMSCFSYAQNISRQVISAQGSFDSNEIMSLEWTLGDAFIETIVTKDHIFTQGFNQSFLEVTKKPMEDEFSIVVFPNPVNSLLNIKVQPSFGSEVNMVLHDINGRFIKQSKQQVKGLEMTMNVSNLQTGIYILRIFNEDSTKVKTHKIVKY